MATLDQSFTTNDSTYGIKNTAAFTYRSQGFTPSVSGTCAQVDLCLAKQGNPTGNVQVGIWSDDGGGQPSSLLSDVVTYNSASLGALAWITFNFSSPATITASTVYHIVVTATYSSDNTNYATWGVNMTGGYGGGVNNYSSDGSTWAGAGTDHDFKQYYNAVVATGDMFNMFI